MTNSDPPRVNYTKLTPPQLRDLKRRYEEQGYAIQALECVRELKSRGVARQPDFAGLRWTQNSVREALFPFAEVARAVPGNERTSYTEAGGTKIGKRTGDPERNWIDSYSGIKRRDINAIFVCLVKAPGDDPTFTLWLSGEPVETYTADRLTEALDRWATISLDATHVQKRTGGQT